MFYMPLSMDFKRFVVRIKLSELSTNSFCFYGQMHCIAMEIIFLLSISLPRSPILWFM